MSENSKWWEHLPFPYSSCEITMGTRPEGFRFYPYIFNIEAELYGRRFLVCGEAHSSELAITKAIAELLERSALFQHAGGQSSNGWAAHTAIAEARSKAIFELVERDAVLAQWYTATPFFCVSDLPEPIRRWQLAELAKSEYPILKVLLSTRGLGPSVTCLMMNEQGFGISSHASGASLEESIEGAIAEACRAAHLSLRREHWQNTLDLKAARVTRIEPGAHGLYYAYQEAFPAWMFGAGIDWAAAKADWDRRVGGIFLSEFTFRPVLHAPLVAGFAANPKALSLSWGTTQIDEILKTIAGQRLAASSTEWNLKPHIVS